MFKEQEGFVYIATKLTGPVVNWTQRFFEWPLQKQGLVEYVQLQTSKKEVYFCPALFKTNKNGTKENWKGTYYVWAEFDGNYGKHPTGILPEPSITIQSSNAGHTHCYWDAGEFITDIASLEQYNYHFAETLEADISGWDGVQLLRPPDTFNYKRNVRTTWIGWENSEIELSGIQSLKSVPNQSVEIPSDLPDLVDVTAKYKYKGDLWILFKKGLPTGDRSNGLMSLGYGLAATGLKNEEILVMLLDADSRWGKFAGRNDRIERLLQIISIAREKYPKAKLQEEEQEESLFKVYGFKSILASKIEIEWIWEGLLQKRGYMLFTGAPKVGKTQFSMDFGAKAVLGKEFLGRPILSKDLRIGFLSLEMGEADLKVFLENQSRGYNEEELERLEENFKLIPVGEPVYLNREPVQDELEELVFELKLDGLIIDSLGESTEHELTNEGDTKSLMHWNSKMRNRHNIFTWWIHHHRKASGDNKKPNKLADIYGSVYITTGVTSALTLWDTGPKALALIPNAIRLAEKPEPFLVYRDGNLHYTIKETGLTVTKKGKEVEEIMKAKESKGFLDQFKVSD